MARSGNDPPFHAIVLAGGFGRRLEDVALRFTGRPTPKQFCRFGGRSLLQDTVLRIAPLVRDTCVIVDASWAHTARWQLRGHENLEIVAQPGDRGTAAGLLLPLARLAARAPDALVLVTPSDHGVEDEDVFRAGLARARLAAQEGPARVVLLGVAAAAPRSEFGWIRPGREIGTDLFAVDGLVDERPARHGGEAQDGELSNTMVIVARVPALLGLLRERRPKLVRFYEEVAAMSAGAARDWLRRCAHLIEPADLRADILEGAPGLAVQRWPPEVGWTDLGTPERLMQWLERDRHE